MNEGVLMNEYHDKKQVIYFGTDYFDSYKQFFDAWEAALHEGKYPKFIGIQCFTDWEDRPRAIPDCYEFLDGEHICEVATIADGAGDEKITYTVSESDIPYYEQRLARWEKRLPINDSHADNEYGELMAHRYR